MDIFLHIATILFIPYIIINILEAFDINMFNKKTDYNLYIQNWAEQDLGSNIQFSSKGLIKDAPLHKYTQKFNKNKFIENIFDLI